MSYLFNIQKLDLRLKEVHVSPDLYEIGGYAEGCLCLEQREDGRWETYFGQRSEKDELHLWESEDDACFWFFGRLAWTEWDS